MNNDKWVVACGGKEPVMPIEGKRYQYHWNMATGEHLYYCFEDDLFLERDQLPECLKH